jgi:hypothetical protein
VATLIATREPLVLFHDAHPSTTAPALSAPAPSATAREIRVRPLPAPAARPDREAQPHYGWALFVGSILAVAVAVVKEGVHSLGANPVASRAKNVSKDVSRSDAAFGMSALIGFAARVGAAAIGPRPG